MRTFTRAYKRNAGFDYNLLEEPMAIGKEFNKFNEIQLSDVAEGESIVDAEYNRPMVKVNGELKQMKVDDRGYVYFGESALSQAITEVKNSSSSGSSSGSGGSTVDTNKTFYMGATFTNADVTLGYKLIGAAPKDSTVISVRIFVEAAFIGLTEIKASVQRSIPAGTPVIIVTEDEIDLTTAGHIYIPYVEILADNNLFWIAFTGTVDTPTYRGYIIIEYINLGYA